MATRFISRCERPESINTGDLFHRPARGRSHGHCRMLSAMTMLQPPFPPQWLRVWALRSLSKPTRCKPCVNLLWTHHIRSGQDPIFNRSKELMRAPDPIFSAFFSGAAPPTCLPPAAAPSTFPDDRYCSRVGLRPSTAKSPRLQHRLVWPGSRRGGSAKLWRRMPRCVRGEG